MLPMMTLTSLSIFMMFFTTLPIPSGFLLLTATLSFIFILSYILSSWFTLTLFLIYIGALLIMFAYFLAITPNKNLKPFNFMEILTSMIILTAIPYINTQTTYLMNFSDNISSPIKDLILNHYLPITLLITITLLLILLIAVKITQKQTGALRPFIYV